MLFPLLLSLFAGARGLTFDGRLHGNFPPIPAIPYDELHDTIPVSAVTGETLPPYNTTYYFDQLIDHTNPSLGTFKQRYWSNWEFYASGT